MQISLHTQDPDERAILYMWLAFELPLEVTYNSAPEKRWWDVRPEWKDNYRKILNGKYDKRIELFVRLKARD